MANKNSTHALFIGTLLLTWVFSIYAAGLIVLATNNPLSEIALYGGFVLWVVMSFLITKSLYKKKFITPFILGMVISLAAIGASGLISRQFVDMSFDGQAYHGEALLQLHEGWNPLYQSESTPLFDRHDPWLDGYPKAAWINGATIFAVTDDIRDVKLFNYLYVVIGVLISYAALTSVKILSWWKSMLIALVANLNIVTLLQLQTRYLDGHMAALIITLLSAFVLMRTKVGWVANLIAVLSLILLINTKLVGIALAVIFCGMYGGYLLLTNKKWVNAAYTLIGGGAIAVFIFGFNPFITNTINYGHPLFPVLGPERIEAFNQNAPSNYLERSNVELFVSAPFFASNPNYNPPEDEGVIKIPFTFDEIEFTEAMNGTGAKVGGFGPLFGGVVLLSLVLYVALIIKESMATEEETNLGLRNSLLVAHFILVGIVLSGIIFNNSNYARLIPQMLMIPLVGVFLGFVSKSKIANLGALVTIVLLGVNYGAAYYFNLVNYNKEVAELNETIERMQKADEPLRVNLGLATATRHRFDENDIEYTLTDESLDCERYGAWNVFPESPVDVCIFD